MDAGKRDSDRASRQRQLEHIISTIKPKTATEALIVAGDLNLSSKSAEDMKLLDNFKDAKNIEIEIVIVLVIEVF